MSRKPWHLSRRTLLRGAGVAVALPMLEQMLPSNARAVDALAPRRFVAMFAPNGILMQRFTPTATGANYDITPILQPLQTIKDKVLVLTGLQNSIAGARLNLHLAGAAAFLTSAFPDGARDIVKNNVSADRLMAMHLGTATRFPSLELSGGEQGQDSCDDVPCVYGRTLSWSSPTAPVLPEHDPQAAFDRLFADGAKPGVTDMEAERRRALRTSILDAVTTDTKSLTQQLGPTDKLKLDEYLSSVRALEVQLVPGGQASSSCSVTGRPADSLANDYPTRVRALLDVTALALTCDVTRVVTFMLAEWESNYVFRFLNLGGIHHTEYSHHGGKPEKFDALEKIDRWEVEQFAYLVNRLAATSELGGSVLDSSAVYFGSDVSDGDTHLYTNMPVLLGGTLGGTIKTGRHLRLDGAPPTANMLLSVMHGMGLSDTTFGNSTGPLDLSA